MLLLSLPLQEFKETNGRQPLDLIVGIRKTNNIPTLTGMVKAKKVKHPGRGKVGNINIAGYGRCRETLGT